MLAFDEFGSHERFNPMIREGQSRDARRYEALREIGCIACLVEGCAQPNRTEVHHLVDNGYRRLSGGNQATIGLCAWHHRGEQIEGDSSREMTEYYGPSMAYVSKRFAPK